MRRRPPSSTRTDTLFPYPTLCRVEVDPTGRTPSASPACDTIEPAQHEEAHVTAYPAWTPAPRPGIVPLHPFGFGTTLGRSFTALRQNPGVLLGFALGVQTLAFRSEEHTSELQSLMRTSYAVFCLKKKKKNNRPTSQ